MFAARVQHTLRPEAMANENRARFDADLMRWSDYLARQPGLDSLTVLLDGDGLLALSIWADAASFQAALAHPDREAAGAPLATWFAAPAEPDFPRMLHHRRP
ncbi:MAG: hypothetical protein U1E34_01520 [Amaricoccus sp.]